MTRIIALALLVIIAGCTTVPKGSFCAIEKPIRLSSAAVDALSDEEVKAVLSHNRRGQQLCSWKP